MSRELAIKRLAREYRNIQNDPVPFIVAKPNEADMFTWYYVVTGPPDSVFNGGQYFGILNFPVRYPYKPPTVTMITPSGRFEPGKNICMSMTNYHPETWNPSWSTSTILIGLLSFMMDTDTALHVINQSDFHKKKLAKESRNFNKKLTLFQQQFPDLLEEDHGASTVLTTAITPLEPANVACASVEPSQVENSNSDLVETAKPKGIRSKFKVSGLFKKAVS